MELEGEVKEIIYKNELNSYCIAVFEITNVKADNNAERIIDSEITIVGYLPFINIGDTLKVIGKMVEHQEYGEQFKVDTFEKMMPQSMEALERYLANGSIKGIGLATAKKIVDTFGEDTVNIFKFEPTKLAQIKGITKEKAIEISESFVENWEVWQIVGFLDKFGIGPQSAETIYKKLGINAIDEIQANPYLLVDLVSKVNFNQIDKMALDIGMEYNNEKRIRSGIKHALILTTYNGHCAVVYENLLKFVNELLGVKIEEIEDVLINMKVKKDLYIEERNGEEWVYLYPYYQAEKNIAEKLIQLDKYKNIKKIPNFKKELKLFEEKSNIELSKKQKEAIEAINNHNVCIITGGPGTGKTTIIKTIIDLYKHNEMKPVLCAPTGRAAKRMTETTGQEAKTLHRLLEIGSFASNETQEVNTNLSVAPIDADIIIVDEMSMVDLFLMNYLCKAIYDGTKLVLVGDTDQLPSVGPGNILKDMIESEVLTTITLNKIFRQAAQSKIIMNSHRVNEGNSFITKGEIEEGKEQYLEDFFYINETDKTKILYQILSLSGERLKNYGDYDFLKNIQIITPTKKGELGTKELNKKLQETVNPAAEDKKERKFGDSIFREGDRIMQIKNNYEIYWEKHEPVFEAGSGIFNGEFGTIQKIDEQEKNMQIKFDDEKVAWYAFNELEQIEHAYAITVHKAQGSEFDVVIMAIGPSAPMLLTRNLLYTGMTRAKKLLIIIGNKNVLDFMIQNADNKKRNTGLSFKLQELAKNI